ncbi:hypothetical protein ACP3VW_02340 [Vibrio sp. DNB22_17_1]
MAQLRKADIQESENGIPFIYIREGEGQNLKNVTSVRQVPIHDHLIELGFLDFACSSNDFLFPDMKVNTNGKRSGYIGKWWGAQVKAAGIEIGSPFHAFRHSFKTLLRGLGVVDSVADALTGHAANFGDCERSFRFIPIT